MENQSMSKDNNEIVPVNSVNKVDITPVLKEIVEYAKDQNKSS